jgi:hypothetical protein
MKAAIGFWSKNELPVWTKLYNTTVLEYNPLENAYRTETTTNTETRNLSGSNNQTRNLTGSNNEIRDLTTGGTHGSTTTGTTTNNGTDTNSEYVIAFNDAATNPTLKAKTEQTLGTGNTVSGTVTNTDTGTDSGTVNHSITDSGTVNNATSDTGTITNSNEFSLKGSIGIITPQQMIEQERNVVKFNIADYIIDSFKTRFCILVY